MAAPNLVSPSSVIGRTEGYAVTTTLTAFLSNAAASNKSFKVVSLVCANIDGINDADLDLSYFNGTTDSFICWTLRIPADSSQVLLSRELFLYLQEGTGLRARASANGDLQLTYTYEDITL
jgi:hypothetical protein